MTQPTPEGLAWARKVLPCECGCTPAEDALLTRENCCSTPSDSDWCGCPCHLQEHVALALDAFAEERQTKRQRRWEDIENEVEQRVATRRIQAEFELNEMRQSNDSLRARVADAAIRALKPTTARGGPGHPDCPNCLGTGEWWDMVFKCQSHCPCDPQWRTKPAKGEETK